MVSIVLEMNRPLGVGLTPWSPVFIFIPVMSICMFVSYYNLSPFSYNIGLLLILLISTPDKIAQTFDNILAKSFSPDTPQSIKRQNKGPKEHDEKYIPSCGSK